jgi:hypothetical protein
MGTNETKVPFIWPDTLELTGISQKISNVPYQDILEVIDCMFGVVTGIDSAGVDWLEEQAEQYPELRIKLVMALYGACATKCSHLERLLSLQYRFKDRFELKLFATEISFLAGSPSNILCLISTKDQTAYLSAGTTANFGIITPLETQANLVFKADAPTVDSWRKWFELLWFKSSPLTENTANIPELQPARGTDEAEMMWREYEEQCRLALERMQTGDIIIEVDPETGEVTAKDENGQEVEMPTKNLNVARLDQVANRIARLYSKGAMVTVDKASRIPPLDAPIRSEWFGVKALRQIGAVTREVKYRISVLDDKLLKDLENRRKSIRQIINAFSFPLADGVYWMPDTARNLLEQELNRVNKEGREALDGAIGNDVDKFVGSQINRIIEDANKMYKDFNPNGQLGKEVIDEIVSDLSERLKKAVSGRFLPQISYMEVSFSPKLESEAVSSWGQALSIVEAIAKFPRELVTDPFKMRGLKVSEREYAQVMDICNDTIHQRRPFKEEIREELDFVKGIMKEGFTHREKCELLFDIIGGKSRIELNVKIAEFVTKNKEPNPGI